MSGWTEIFLIVLYELFVFGFGAAVGYSCGTEGMDELKSEKSVMQYTKLEADLKEAVTQRDECRRFVREWAAPVRPAKK